MIPVRLEPTALRSRVKHSTTERIGLKNQFVVSESGRFTQVLLYIYINALKTGNPVTGAMANSEDLDEMPLKQDHDQTELQLQAKRGATVRSSELLVKLGLEDLDLILRE